MVLEDQRFIHEDLERLEQAIADRVAEEPRNVSDSNKPMKQFMHTLSDSYYRSGNASLVTMNLPSFLHA